MKETVKEILDITRHALNQMTYDKPITDEKSIYMLALESGLSALVHQALDQSLISDKLKTRLQKNFYDYISKDAKQQEVIIRVDQILTKAHIDHVFLKGAMLKNLYPETYLRGMGDIDLLIKTDELKHVHEVFREEKITCKSRSKQHDVFETEDGLLIEIHPILYKDFNIKYETLFNHPWDFAYQEKPYHYKFEHEFEIIYLLYHLAKHMDSGGIGLRSALDIGMYLNAFEKDMDEVKLRTLLKETDMTKFYQTMIEINKIYFEFCYDLDIHNEFNLSETLVEELTDYLVRSGIHGQGHNFNPFEARMASYELRNKSRFKMVMDIAFPSYDSMKSIYPFVAKSRCLIIFGWMHRWMKLIFKKTKSTFKKIKSLFVKNDAVERNKELFEKIGLK